MPNETPVNETLEKIGITRLAVRNVMVTHLGIPCLPSILGVDGFTKMGCVSNKRPIVVKQDLDFSKVGSRVVVMGRASRHEEAMTNVAIVLYVSVIRESLRKTRANDCV
jgi:hypothetical protein